MGTLFLVATPIGNLEDISARALRLLAQVSLIAAEDTRHTRKLLDHFLIRTPMTSYHEHNKLSKVEEILASHKPAPLPQHVLEAMKEVVTAYSG